MNILTYILFVFLVAGSSVESFSQNTGSSNNLDSGKLNSPLYSLFGDIEKGISENNVKDVSRFFSAQTYFSLPNGKSGYYSANQAFYVLEDFLKIYKVISLRLNNISVDEQNPYATGIYTYEFRGKKDSAQVYISLKHSDNGWKIVQITVN